MVLDEAFHGRNTSTNDLVRNNETFGDGQLSQILAAKNRLEVASRATLGAVGMAVDIGQICLTAAGASIIAAMGYAGGEVLIGAASLAVPAIATSTLSTWIPVLAALTCGYFGRGRQWRTLEQRAQRSLIADRVRWSEGVRRIKELSHSGLSIAMQERIIPSIAATFLTGPSDHTLLTLPVNPRPSPPGTAPPDAADADTKNPSIPSPEARPRRQRTDRPERSDAPPA